MTWFLLPVQVVLKTLQEVIQSVVRAAPEAWAQEAMQYVSGMCAFLIGVKDFDVEHWTEVCLSHLHVLFHVCEVTTSCPHKQSFACGTTASLHKLH